MSTTESLNHLLASGPPAFKFEKVGDTAKGVMLAADEEQVTDIKTNKPLFWDNGKARMQLVITLRQDDGTECRVFCKPNARAAIAEAVKRSGADFMLGGRLAVRYKGDEPSDSPGMSPKKLFDAQYEPPKVTIDQNADDLL